MPQDLSLSVLLYPHSQHPALQSHCCLHTFCLWQSHLCSGAYCLPSDTPDLLPCGLQKFSAYCHSCRPDHDPYPLPHKNQEQSSPLPVPARKSTSPLPFLPEQNAHPQSYIFQSFLHMPESYCRLLPETRRQSRSLPS